MSGPARRGEPLTYREAEVLRYMADGRTNHEISQIFFVSEDTVKSHVRHIFAKLGVRGRGGAVGAAYRRGILDAGAPAVVPQAAPAAMPKTWRMPPQRDPRLQRIRHLITRWETTMQYLPPVHPLRRFVTDLAGILDGAEDRESA
jgi:DNA-binding CsgD family transcriptional regulator